jgi:hypothetical protein
MICRTTRCCPKKVWIATRDITSSAPKKPSFTYLQFTKKMPPGVTSCPANLLLKRAGKKTASTSTFTVHWCLSKSFSWRITPHKFLKIGVLIHVFQPFLSPM